MKKGKNIYFFIKIVYIDNIHYHFENYYIKKTLGRHFSLIPYIKKKLKFAFFLQKWFKQSTVLVNTKNCLKKCLKNCKKELF